ncbi:MAG: LPS export ABC transporter permease LptG [Desulfobacteraceae bacterium]|nr:LPS export ABC transporter permease LptG [Desulfobacteraceae bacterium]MCF8095526.1 LPS export ABC transporter permease LptG [Desulfobacteraceae bacterium]
MTVIHRYITASFLKYFFLVLIVVVGIYLSVDFIGRLDDFIESGRSPAAVGFYFLLKIPLILSRITPLAVLLSVLIIFGLMNKNNEIIALKSGGISVFYLLVPIAVLGTIFSVLLFVFSESVVPISAAKATSIEENKDRDSRAVSSKEKNIWIRQGDKIININHYHPAEDVLYGITVYSFDSGFNLVRRIDAASAVYEKSGWLLYDCMEQRFDRNEVQSPAGSAPLRYDEKRKLDLKARPADFRRVARDAEEMGFAELLAYIEKTKAEGYDATRYRVDLYAKTAFPLVCLIMSLMGAGLALRGKTRDGMVVSFAYGIITAFVYWSVYSFSLSLGYGEVLPAWLAAWSTNILFGFVSLSLLLSLE